MSFPFRLLQKSAVRHSTDAIGGDRSLQDITQRDDIYIDDQHIEGSGGRGEVSTANGE